MAGPRIRSLKPECWHDEALGRVSRDARLLFIVLITLADDEGRFRAIHTLINGHGYPYDPDAQRKLEGWLNELSDADLVVLYEADGVPYGAFPSWSQHQRITRHTGSSLPVPPGFTVRDQGVTEPKGVRDQGVTERSRREMARRHGAVAGETTIVPCHFCGQVGRIRWARMANGKPSSWVSFDGIDLQANGTECGGNGNPCDSLVFACLECGHGEGHGKVTGFRDLESRDSVL